MKVRMTESEYKKYLNYRKRQIRESYYYRDSTLIGLDTRYERETSRPGQVINPVPYDTAEYHASIDDIYFIYIIGDWKASETAYLGISDGDGNNCIEVPYYLPEQTDKLIDDANELVNIIRPDMSWNNVEKVFRTIYNS